MFVRQILVCALSVLACATPLQGAVTAWTDVTVRVYDVNGALTGTNVRALDHARATLEAASLTVVWRLCTAPHACDAPLESGELAIRIVRSPGPRRYAGLLPLGDAMLDTRTGRGVLATVYVDRVEWLAREARADSHALLGRAIAHELGHLLLATTRHGPTGLMRALWSQDEVRRGQARDWSFAPTELATLRRRAEERQRESRLAMGTR